MSTELKAVLAMAAFGPVMMTLGLIVHWLFAPPFNPLGIVGTLGTCVATPIALFVLLVGNWKE